MSEAVSCEALLAEALETLAKFPGGGGSQTDLASWYYQRARPTQIFIEAFLYGVDPPDSVTPST